MTSLSRLGFVHHFRNISLYSSQCTRNFCYKAVKRPSLIKQPVKSKLAETLLCDMSLSKQLQARILATGPITVADYMREVLTNPSAGYYMKKDVFGEKGDFITSPEIGQIFGELVAVWCLSEWEKCGAPSPLQLVELGPGRGTFAQDILRVLSRFGLSDRISLHLVEVSPHLSNLQATRLCCKYADVESDEKTPHYKQGETISGFKTFWYQKIEDVPQGFTIFLAHEFFDALPIHKFQIVDNKWREIMVDVEPGTDNQFRYVVSKADTSMLSVLLNRPWAQEGLKGKTHFEYSVETEKIIQNLASRIDEFGGFSLIMDYGHFGDKSDTFRAFKEHTLHDPLLDPGTADLTADVNFKSMKATAEHLEKLITFGPVEQKDFLKQLGGEPRIEVLVKNAKNEEEASNLKSGYDMLTSPDQMGSRFKFFSMFPKVLEKHLLKFPVNGFR